MDGDSDKVVAVVTNATNDQLQAYSDHIFI